MAVEQVFIERYTGSIPEILGLLLEAPLGESVNASQCFGVAVLMGRSHSGEQLEEYHVDTEIRPLHILPQVGEKRQHLPTPTRHQRLRSLRRTTSSAAAASVSYELPETDR